METLTKIVHVTVDASVDLKIIRERNKKFTNIYKVSPIYYVFLATFLKSFFFTFPNRKKCTSKKIHLLFIAQRQIITI